MAEISVAEARKNFSDALNRVAYGKERLRIKRRGKVVAALVPPEDLDVIEAVENKIDLAEARRILAHPREKPIPWKKAKKQLGL
jgi:prevent-host-death family protein